MINFVEKNTISSKKDVINNYSDNNTKNKYSKLNSNKSNDIPFKNHLENKNDKIILINKFRSYYFKEKDEPNKNRDVYLVWNKKLCKYNTNDDIIKIKDVAPYLDESSTLLNEMKASLNLKKNEDILTSKGN